MAHGAAHVKQTNPLAPTKNPMSTAFNMGKVNTAAILKTMLFLKINRVIKMPDKPANVISRKPVIRIVFDMIVDITFFV
jgi:hypothetical protein